MDELKDEIPLYQSNLQVQSLVVPSLLYLMNNGVTEEDIINMSQLIVLFQNSKFLTNASSQSGNTSNGIENNAGKNSKNETWKLLINELRSIQSIDSEIEKLIIHRNELRSEINHLNTKKNAIEEPYIEISETYVDQYFG